MANFSGPLGLVQILTDLYISGLSTIQFLLAHGMDTFRAPYIVSILSIVQNGLSLHLDPNRGRSITPDTFLDIYKLEIPSLQHTNLLEVLEQADCFLQTASHWARKIGGSILIQCPTGLDLSPFVATAFVMRDLKVDYKAAVRLVRGAHPRFFLSLVLEQQLRLWGSLKHSIYDTSGGEKPEYSVWKQGNAMLMEQEQCALQWWIMEADGVVEAERGAQEPRRGVTEA